MESRLVGEAKPDEYERKTIAEFEVQEIRIHTLVVLAFKIFLEKQAKRDVWNLHYSF